MNFKNAFIKIQCKHCGKTFKDFKGNHRRFCSRECWSKRNPPLLFYCLNCGKEFKDYITYGRKFCSKKCFGLFKRGCVAWNKGKKGVSEETSRKMSLAQRGRKLFEETKQRISESHRGENAYQWKGDKVGYRGLHRWINRELGRPQKCEFCGKDRLKGHQIHWANKSRKYLRLLTDWVSLCVPCHKEYDKVI